jgi:glycine/D-amino acid oxidase-like deaminating enzyme
VERQQISAEATASSQGLILGPKDVPRPDAGLFALSHELYRELTQELDDDIEFTESGCLLVARSEDAFHCAVLLAGSVDGQVIDVQYGEELRYRYPWLSERILGGVVFPRDGQVNPTAVANALMRGAQRNGARFLAPETVIGFLTSRGVLEAVVTDVGSITTPCAVIAAGNRSPQLIHMLGDPLRIVPVYGQLLVIEPLSQEPMPSVLEAVTVDFATAKEGSEEDAAAAVRFVFSQSGRAHALIGSVHAASGLAETAMSDWTQLLVERAVRYMPILGDSSHLANIRGWRPGTPDGKPVVDWLPTPAGVIVATGHGGEGITLAPVTGLGVADFVLGVSLPGEVKGSSAWRWHRDLLSTTGGV